jgi:hypothetical protein
MRKVVMARGPDGSDIFEVVHFHSPSAGTHEPAPAGQIQPQDRALPAVRWSLVCGRQSGCGARRRGCAGAVVGSGL